jgi:hypothetical protein
MMSMSFVMGWKFDLGRTFEYAGAIRGSSHDPGAFSMRDILASNSTMRESTRLKNSVHRVENPPYAGLPS